METKEPRFLIEAVRYFADPDVCLNTIVKVRWPDGVKCPTCGSEKVSFLTTQRRWQCSTKHSKRQFSAKVGTVFEDSPIGLDKWLPVVWLLTNCKNGISSYEVARDLKVTQKTGWFMLHRVRLAMQGSTFWTKLEGEIEADETFIGGLARNMHKNKKSKITGTGGTGSGKAVVMGLLDRKRKQVRIVHVPNVQRATLQAQVRKYVQGGSYLFTDAWLGYHGLDRE
jgi:transposase-like protein